MIFDYSSGVNNINCQIFSSGFNIRKIIISLTSQYIITIDKILRFGKNDFSYNLQVQSITCAYLPNYIFKIDALINKD
jgi:hypothetical protein